MPQSHDQGCIGSPKIPENPKDMVAFTPKQDMDNVSHKYTLVDINAQAAIKSWKLSLFSYEWLDKNGEIKSCETLPPQEQVKRKQVEILIKNSLPLPIPILGIGVMDNIEIGSGRDVFLTLAALGAKTIPAYIPKSQEKFFKSFIHQD